MRLGRVDLSRRWIGAALVGVALVAIAASIDQTIPAPYGYGKQASSVAMSLVVTAVMATLAGVILRAERRRPPPVRPASRARFAGGLIAFGLATAGAVLALSGSPGGAAFGGAVAIVVLATAAWGRPSALLVPTVALWPVALLFVAYSVVDAWVNPLPPTFVPVGGMDGFGQDQNDNAALTSFFYVVGCLYFVVPQLAGLVLGAVWRRARGLRRPERTAALGADALG